MKSFKILLIIFCLGLWSSAFAAPITKITIDDYKKIAFRLDEHFYRTSDGHGCKITSVEHELGLTLKGNSFKVQSVTYFQCEGSFKEHKDESCVIVKEKNQWILEYCDSVAYQNP